MLFNSLPFIAFFIAVSVAYYAIPHKFRWSMLLAASCAFYMAFIPAYILILLATILVDYFAALKMEKTQGHLRRLWLIASILMTCAILFFFKYFNFFNENAAHAARFL